MTIIYDGPEGTIHALADGTGYTAEDDGGPIEGTFRTLVDAHAAIGSIPPEYPIAPGDITREDDVAEVVLEECPHCHGQFVSVDAHLNADKERDRCHVFDGPGETPDAEDPGFEALEAHAKAMREARR